MSVNSMRLQKIIKEDKDVKRLGISVKYMCLSLMCEHHKSLHGELFDFGEVTSLYDLDNIPEGCRCGVTQILVDETGKPRNPAVLEKAKSQTNHRDL
ncbi:hypothetical protein AAG587_06720 [Vreelandella neptunia]|uniref:hypothetical protein n=1 Tax=Vreelandella neptunia TaxID=115551 RepID=UPI00315AF937